MQASVIVWLLKYTGNRLEYDILVQAGGNLDGRCSESRILQSF